MTPESVLLLLVAVALLAAVAHRVALPEPLVYVAGGLALSFLPGAPTIVFDPDLVFALFFPATLFGAAWSTSWSDFRANLGVILLLSVGVVAATTVAVAGVARVAVPGLAWPLAFLLAVIVADPDTSVFSRAAAKAGVPRPLATVLNGEGLVEGSVTLVLFVAVLGAVESGTFSAADVGLRFVVGPVIGVTVGLAVAWLLGIVMRRVSDPTIDITLSLAAPFAAYIPAEALGGTRIPAVVAAGLYLGWHSRETMTATTRINGQAVWQTFTFLVSGFIYIPLGLALRGSLDGADGEALATLLGQIALLSLTVVVVRFAVVVGQFVVRRAFGGGRDVPWSHVIVGGWAPTRGTFAMASAIALPLALAERDLFVLLSLGVVLATVALQGLTLPWLIRRLDVHDDGRGAREEALAWQATAEAALTRIDDLARSTGASGEPLQHVRAYYADRARRYAGGDGVAPISGDLALRRALITVERDRLGTLRQEGDISDSVLRSVEQKLDVMEEYLS